MTEQFRSEPSNQARIKVPFREACPSIGSIYTVDEFREDASCFSLHLTIENSGEFGDIQLELDHSTVHCLDQKRDVTWARSYPLEYIRGNMNYLHEALRLIEPEVFEIWPEESQMSCMIRAGEVWKGWLSTYRLPLPAECRALVLFVSQIKPEGLLKIKPHAQTCFWISLDRVRPFIALGEEVRIQPAPTYREIIHNLSHPLRWAIHSVRPKSRSDMLSNSDETHSG